MTFYRKVWFSGDTINISRAKSPVCHILARIPSTLLGVFHSERQSIQVNKEVVDQLGNNRSLSSTSQFISHPTILRYVNRYCLLSWSVQFYVWAD